MPDSPVELRSRLLARIARRYDVRTVPVTIGPVELSFVRVADPDRVLDQVAEEEDRRERTEGKRRDGDELHLPYWAELWDSALAVSQYLASPSGSSLLHRPDGTPASVLDLGCGMGLTGTMAAALGARVLFADLEQPALLFAQLNSLPWRDRVRTRRMNWRTDRLGETFDLILGADILYERKQWEYLEPFWQTHLAPHGRILLGEPGRQTGDLFPTWLADRKSWRLTLHHHPVPTRPQPIRLFELNRQ